MSDASSCTDKVALQDEAFTIFSGHVANDAIAKNNTIRVENMSLQAPRDLLLKVRVQKDGDDFWVGSLLDCQEDEQEEEHFILSINDVDPFPLEEITGLSCTISGFSVHQTLLNRFQWGDSRFCTVNDDETLELNLKFGDSCFLVGMMENFSGTIEYMRQMIANYRLVMHMHTFGAIDLETGEPDTRDRDEHVEGSTFRLTKIKVPKDAIQPIRDQQSIATMKVADDELVKELQKLSKTYGVNRTLGIALEERTALLRENILLKASRDIIQAVQVRFPGGGVIVRNLSDGERPRDDTDAWWMIVSPTEESRVPLLSVGQMQIFLSGFPLQTSHLHVQGVQFMHDPVLMHLRYNEVVDAFFAFDPSWDDMDESVLRGRDVVEWVRLQLVGAIDNGATYAIPNYTGRELFMRLILLKFRLGVVSECLHALGIDVSPANDDVAGEEGREE